jgi:hypothetical protein
MMRPMKGVRRREAKKYPQNPNFLLTPKKAMIIAARMYTMMVPTVKLLPKGNYETFPAGMKKKYFFDLSLGFICLYP